jgi:hypothetical protein
MGKLSEKCACARAGTSTREYSTVGMEGYYTSSSVMRVLVHAADWQRYRLS